MADFDLRSLILCLSFFGVLSHNIILVELLLFLVSGDFRLVCGCGKSFTAKHNLDRHSRGCGNEKRFMCLLCPYKTHRSDSLNGHIKRKHYL